MPVVRWIYRNMLNSVPFGILLMVSIGIYIAVGSGWVGLREYLEMDEMLFFNWWPLKLLTALLIINLTVVTVVRIPLTVPRYGVWCIHMGIILLLMSLSAYYTRKTEGLVPMAKGQTATTYYDRWERALYLRTPFGNGMPIALEGLPRFHDYDVDSGNGKVLAPLAGLSPQVRVVSMQDDRRSIVPLHESLGLSEPVKFDIVGYYPYAESERWRIDEKVRNVGLRVRTIDAPEGSGTFMVASQPADAIIPLGEAVLEHRHLPTKADIDLSTAAVKRLHKLTIQTGNNKQDVFVEPGETIDVGNGAYTLKVEGFTPQFQLSDGKRSADTLTVLVTKRATPPEVEKPFRRTILSNLDPAAVGTQTDFELNVEGAGPFGKRKRDGLLDTEIQLAYSFNDLTKLLPTVQDTTVKYLLLTADDTPGITLLRVSARDTSFVSSTADDHVDLRVTAPAGMFQGSVEDRELVRLNVQRFNHVALSDRIVSLPREKRDKTTAQAGVGQMVRVRVRCGNWSQDVPVPFTQFAAIQPWSSAKVQIPGAKESFQLMLGNLVRPMPLPVRLDAFEPVAYAGGDLSGNGFMRDFKSTLSILDENRTIEATAQLNSPAFFRMPSIVPFLPGESWLLSPATWDPNNLNTTVLQVGNRPAVHMMTIACVMIFVGLMYAFYVKPIVIRKMKEAAIREARDKKRRQDMKLVPSASGQG